MTEKEFWLFLKDAVSKGRAEQYIAVRDTGDPQIAEVGRYIGSHAILPKDYQDLSKREIVNMGRLLFNENTSISTKEALLILLAQQPSREALTILRSYYWQPDQELRVFAQMALDECEMWNQTGGMPLI